MLKHEAYILDIAEAVSSGLGDVLDVSTIHSIPRPAGKENISDSTLAFTINGRERSNDIVLLVSNPLYPDVIRDDVKRARSVAGLVDADVSKHISLPIYEGSYGKQSYAAFRRLDLFSNNRLIRLFQKRFCVPKIVLWNVSLALQTQDGRADCYERYFVEPLEWIIDDPQCSRRMRDLASRCFDEQSKSKRDLWTVVEHGDFWIGNVLLGRKNSMNLGLASHEFTVIDWRGSRNDGYPCVDVLRLLQSVYKKGSKRANLLLGQYQNHLEISDFEVAIYAALSLGRLSKNLDHFPRERFNTLCENTLDFLQHSGRI